jgi:hypothetical protein
MRTGGDREVESRLLHLALVAPEACEAHGGAEFPRLHSFKTLINDCSLRLAIFRKLLNTSLEDWVGILKRAPDWTKQFQLHPAIRCRSAAVAMKRRNSKLSRCDCDALRRHVTL